MKSNEIINVYNYSDSPIILPTNSNPRGYVFEPSLSEDTPSVIPLPLDEIKMANTRSNIFREGYLRFEKEVEEEVYNELKIVNWKDILSTPEINDIILHPTKERLEKVIALKTLSAIDRVREQLVVMKNSGVFDISERVVKLINARYRELYNGKVTTKIKVYKTQQEEDIEKQNDLRKEAVAKALAEERKKIEAEVRAEIEAELKGKTEEKTEEKKTTPRKPRQPKKAD